MDTKKIQALLLSAEAGSLTSAAERLGYTQSGLTHMMNALEDELGLNLLIRSKQGVRLSPEGEALKSRLEALLKASEELEKASAALRREGAETLRLGAYSSVMRNWMSPVLAEFRSRCPDTELSLDAGSIMQVYSWVKSGRVDVGIASFQKSQMAGLSFSPLRADPLVAVLPESYEGGDFFPVEAYSGREFIMPADNFDMDINPVLGQVCPKISYTNMDDAAVLSMVAHGLGISMLSELVVQGMDKGVHILPLSPAASRTLGVLTVEKRAKEKHIRQFIRSVEAVIKKMYPYG